MDIRLIRKQLQIEFANLNTSDFDSIEIAANDFFDFLHTTPVINKMISGLPNNTIDVEEWIKTLYNSSISMPRDKEERISFLLAVLEKYKSDLLSIAHYFHAGSRKYVDHIHKYVDTMVKPIYQYFDNLLHIKELEISPVSTVSITANNSIIINGNNYGSVSQTNIDTVEALGELSQIVQKSAELTDEQKLETVNNIDTIKNQVVSPNPNKKIIKLAWETVSAMANIAGATDLTAKIVSLLANING